MTPVFADTGYWIALWRPRDALYEGGRTTRAQLANDHAPPSRYSGLYHGRSRHPSSPQHTTSPAAVRAQARKELELSAVYSPGGGVTA